MFSVEYLIIRPLPYQGLDMKVSYAQHWKSDRAALDIGHRGSGNSYHVKWAWFLLVLSFLSLITNSIFFFVALPKSRRIPYGLCNMLEKLWVTFVHEHLFVSSLFCVTSPWFILQSTQGADFVEFDVQLSQDRVPVVYHDFNVCVAVSEVNFHFCQMLLSLKFIYYSFMYSLMDHFVNHASFSLLLPRPAQMKSGGTLFLFRTWIWVKWNLSRWEISLALNWICRTSISRHCCQIVDHSLACMITIEWYASMYTEIHEYFLFYCLYLSCTSMLILFILVWTHVWIRESSTERFVSRSWKLFFLYSMCLDYYNQLFIPLRVLHEYALSFANKCHTEIPSGIVSHN